MTAVGGLHAVKIRFGHVVAILPARSGLRINT